MRFSWIERATLLVLILNWVNSASSIEAPRVNFDSQFDWTVTILPNFQIVNGTTDDGWIAQATFSDQIQQNGWSYLRITTNQIYPDSSQARAAGLAEGYLTARLIYLFWKQQIEAACAEEDLSYMQSLLDFLESNGRWMQENIKNESRKSSFWHQVDLMIRQTDGLEEGYFRNGIYPELNCKDGGSKIGKIFLSKFAFRLLQMSGDLNEITAVLANKSSVLNPTCSALVKLLPGNRDLYTGHVTWNSYINMLRLVKVYEFKYRQTASSLDRQLVPGIKMTFSSYPGMLMSLDDYYQISSGLLVLETSLAFDSSKVNIREKTVLSHIRCMVANRLATSGKEWTEFFGKHSSGTYVNEWVIVDYNKFSSGETELQDGLLWVLDEIPGHIVSEDRTGNLRKRGYFASYNLPSIPKIYEISEAHHKFQTTDDAYYSPTNSARAQIFKRDHNKVVDLNSFTKLMRHNDFKNDPLSVCQRCTPKRNGVMAISARADLSEKNGNYTDSIMKYAPYGGCDMKMTNSSMSANMQLIIVGGPTWDQQPPFQWSLFEKNNPEQTFAHPGQPDLWKFDPVFVGIA